MAGDGAGDYTLSKVEFSDEDIKKGDYPHYMLKEIFEQPGSVHDAMRGRLSAEESTAKLGGLEMTAAELRAVGRIVLTGCGTALHAAMVGEYILEKLAGIPTEVEFASEFRHRNTPMTGDTVVFAISQSGETADTLGALRESRRKGYRTLGICNNVASTIARESDGGVYMHAGPGDRRGRDQIVHLASEHSHCSSDFCSAECAIFPVQKAPALLPRWKNCLRKSRRP